MNNAFQFPKQLVIFGIVIPVALVLGYFLASPGDLSSVGFVGMVVGVLSIPILLRWHHPLLIFAWNFPCIVFFLPGQPNLWIVMGACSFGLSVLARVMEGKVAFKTVPSLAWPLLALALVVIVTAKFTGGFGMRSMGGETYGGKKFIFILVSIMGFFAMGAQRIRAEKANFYTGLYFLPGFASVISNLAYMAGPGLWFLFYVFPADTAIDQAMEDFQGTFMEAKFTRLSGLTFSCMAVFCYMLARYGLRGVMDWRRWWRGLFFLAMIGLSTLGGFRSFVVIVVFTFFIQFFYERLYRTRLALIILLIGVLSAAVVIPFSDKLPLSVQRSLSFLPLNIDPVARAHALASTQWREDMWSLVIPQIPQYFWLGKGYSLDATDLYLTQQAMVRGMAQGYEYSMKAGDYHSGPLSVIIPLGIFGVIAFLWFSLAAIRWLYRRHRECPAHLQTINTFLLSYFLARYVFFFVGFGSLFSDLPMFVGLVGLSVALNGTEPEMAEEAQAELAALEPEAVPT